MNSRSRIILVFALALVLTSITSIEAQSKRRAVKPGSPTGAAPPATTGLLTGTILDSTTNAPVVNVTVRAGSRSGRSDAHGNFFIKLQPGVATDFTFERTGYDPLNTSVTINGDETQTFRMIPRPTVKIRMTAGATYDVDPETVEFGYAAPFSGYIKDSKLKLCKSGGDSFTPDRADIKHITTGVQLNDAKCCGNSVAAINVELKSGGTTTGAFVDECQGYKEDVVAIDHVTFLPVYLHFSDIAELTFP